MTSYLTRTIIASLTLIASFLGAMATPLQAAPMVKVDSRQLKVYSPATQTYEPYFIRGVAYSPTPIGRHPSDWGYSDGSPRPPNILEDTDILERDFTLLEAMHANTIRLWKGNDTQSEKRFPTKLTTITLDHAQQHNLKVIAGFWVEPLTFTLNAPDNTYHIDQESDLRTRFTAYVNQFKGHPAILFWAIGNENNYSISGKTMGELQAKLRAWYTLVDAMAADAHKAEGANYHPVAVVNGEIEHIGDPTYGAADKNLPSLDIWGANVYRGKSFYTLFNSYASQKPLWISEFGIDAWKTASHANINVWWNPLDTGAPANDTQSAWDSALWDEIVDNNRIAIGGTVMEYSDEWWKPYEWQCAEGPVTPETFSSSAFPMTDIDKPALFQDLLQNDYLSLSSTSSGYLVTKTFGDLSDSSTFILNPAFEKQKDAIFQLLRNIWDSAVSCNTTQNHFGEPFKGFPDSFMNAEWFGLMAISKNPAANQPDVMAPRKVYRTLQTKFAPPVGTVAINNGATATASTTVTLTLAATHAGSRLRPDAQMQLSSNGIVWKAAEPYLSAKSWLLPSGDGIKTVYVRFKDAGSDWSPAAFARIRLDTAPPAQPKKLTAVAVSPVSVRLNWAPSTDNNGFVTYRVLRNNVRIATTAVPSFSDTGLTPNTTYSYKIIAADSSGNLSTESSTVTVRTPRAYAQP